MKNTFNWVVHVEAPLKKATEKKIDVDLTELGYFIPCHPGPLLVSILSTDELEQTLSGNVRCQCGQQVATFSGASDGSNLDYHPCEQ